MTLTILKLNLEIVGRSDLLMIRGKMKNKKIAITGGAGFIGSRLAHALADNNKIVIIDDLSTGNMENIADLIGIKDVSFIQASITNLKILKDALFGIDLVYHEAGVYVGDFLKTNEINITGTLNVLLAARDNNIDKVVFASSSAVYGNTKTIPVVENMPLLPQTVYALSKLAGEEYCRIFTDVYGLKTTCLRYFNVYGPGQSLFSPACLIPIIVSKINQNQSPVIFGDGEQTRDFIFVDDVVRANILAADSNNTGVFNIGTGNESSIKFLVEEIMSLMGKYLPFVYQEPRSNDIKRSRADTSKAKIFGFEASYKLEQGLRETLLLNNN